MSGNDHFVFSIDTFQPTTAEIDGLCAKGLSFHQKGLREDAEACYRRVLSVAPAHAGAIHYLGVLLLAKKQHGRAIDLMQRSVQLAPDNPIYRNNYGVALREIGKRPLAEEMFRKAITIKPDYADAWSNLGQIQMERGLFSDAEQSLQKALALSPRHPDAPVHLADLYGLTKRYDEGVDLCRKILAYRPSDPVVLKLFGRTLLRAKRFEAAQSIFEKLLPFEPYDKETLSALGIISAELGRYAQGKAYCMKTKSTGKQTSYSPWKYLEICPTVFQDVESIDRYRRFLSEELDILKDESVSIDWKNAPVDCILPSFNLTHHGKICKDIREKFFSLYRDSFPHTKPVYKPKKRIRVGFVTSPGNEGGLLRGTAGTIDRLDRSTFAPVLFGHEKAKERLRRSLNSEDTEIVTFSDDFEAASKTLREAACDVLYYWKIERGTWNPFLALTRPAPVQCTSWGTIGTSGLDAVDYYLTSPYMEPEGVDVDDHYTEKVVFLDTFPMYETKIPHPGHVKREEFGLPENGAIYFCPHRIGKYHPVFDDYLKQILENDPQGLLLVKIESGTTSSGQLKNRLAENLGDALMKRVRFTGNLSHEKYVRLFSLTTLVLDSPVYTGGFVAYDAFSLGVPIVTLQGEIGIQTFSSGFYRKMDMPEMVCRSPEEYVSMAKRIGCDKDFRDEVSRRIAERSDSIFEDGKAVETLERFFVWALEKEGAQ